MSKLVVINACVRQDDSRTLRVAEPIIEALSKRYAVVRYDLPQMDFVLPLSTEKLAERDRGVIAPWALEAAKNIAEADRIIIASPFWDMSFPAVLKCFFEQTTLFGVTFVDDGKTCSGLCKSPKVLYITTRGSNIATGDPLEQATPYIKAIGTLWNLGELTTLAVTNTDYAPDELETKLSACISQGLALAETW